MNDNGSVRGEERGMRGCLRTFMIMLVLVLLAVLGLGVYITIERNPDDVFGIIIYSCGFVLCLFLFMELCKWKRRF